MASGRSAYLQAALLDAELSGVPYTSPTTIFFALSSAVFDQSATSAAMSEIAGGGYARVSLAANLTNFPSATGVGPTTKATGAAITFPTATGSWGDVVSIYALDQLGNVLRGADLPEPVAVGIGSSINIPPGSGLFTETGTGV